MAYPTNTNAAIARLKETLDADLGTRLSSEVLSLLVALQMIKAGDATGGGGGGGGASATDIGIAVNAAMKATAQTINLAFTADAPVTAPYRNVALSNTPQLVKGSAGRLYGWELINQTAAPVYLNCYDAATTGAVTVGTTTPHCKIVIPAGGYRDQPVSWPQRAFSAGLVIAAVTGLADNSNTAPTTGLYTELRYA